MDKLILQDIIDLIRHEIVSELWIYKFYIDKVKVYFKCYDLFYSILKQEMDLTPIQARFYIYTEYYKKGMYAEEHTMSWDEFNSVMCA